MAARRKMFVRSVGFVLGRRVTIWHGAGRVSGRGDGVERFASCLTCRLLYRCAVVSLPGRAKTSTAVVYACIGGSELPEHFIDSSTNLDSTPWIFLTGEEVV